RFRGNAEMNGVAAATPPDRLAQKWTLKTGDALEGAPAIVGGVAYVGSYDQHLYAIDLANGQVRWKVKLGPFKASPAVRGEVVYVGDADGKLYAMAAKDGALRWKFETEGEITSGASIAVETARCGPHEPTLCWLG